MSGQDTKKRIVDAFIERVEEGSLGKVRVAELIGALQINRNTFYYYFPSKYDVAMSVLFEDLDRELRSRLNESELVYSTLPGKDQLDTRYAIYAHVETGARTLDASAFTQSLVSCLLARRRFYGKLFTREENDFTLRIRNLYEPLLAADADFMLGGRYMPPQTKRLLVSWCVAGILDCAEFIVREGGSELLDSSANPFANVIHESLFAAIQAHPVNRRSGR